jgi:hypothetical protein
MLGLFKIAPSQARPCHGSPQSIGAALKHKARYRQTLFVVQGEVAIDRITPPPVAQEVMAWSVAAEAEFNARRIGTS